MLYERVCCKRVAREVSTGQTFAALLKQHVFDPLGMRRPVSAFVLNGTRVLRTKSVREMTRNQIGTLPFAGVRAIEYGANDGCAHLGLGYGVAVITGSEAADMGLPTGSYGWMASARTGSGTFRACKPCSSCSCLVLAPSPTLLIATLN